ncbi:MAG: hypothetical protein WC707_02040 [Candidatus Babeliaceae bacterium]|jgi:hypothetical protein
MNYAQIYFKKKQLYFEKIADFRVLFGALFTATIIIFIVFIIALSRARISDSSPQITPINEAVYDPKNIIKVAFLIENFNQFEIIKNNFTVMATVLFIADKSLDKTLLDTFSFENGSFISKSTPYQYPDYNDKMVIAYDIKLEYHGSFNYRHYPFDYHQLNFILSNKHIPYGTLLYMPINNEILKKNTFTKDWINTKTSTAYGTTTLHVLNDKKATYEVAAFSYDFKRSSLKEIFFIFLPLFLIFFIGLLSLTFDVMNQFSLILSLSIGSTTALIFYSDGLQKMAPISGVFTLADAMLTSSFAIVITILALQMISMNYLYKKQSVTTIKELIMATTTSLNVIRGLFFLLFLAIQLIIVIWLLLIN